MTITSNVNKVQIGSGSTITVGDLGAATAAQLVVTRLESDDSETTLVNPTDYTINSDLDTITLVTAIDGTTYKRASVTLDIPETQTSDYINIDPHNTEVTEADLDKTTLKLKQIQEKLDRVIVAPISTPTGSFDLPILDGNAGKYLKLNATENGFDFATVGGITFWEQFTLPPGDGTVNQVLETDGGATLSWTDVTGLPTMNVEASLTYEQSNDVIESSDNIASVVNNSTGDFTVTFTTAMTSSSYGYIASAIIPSFPSFVVDKASGTRTTSVIDLNTIRILGGSTSFIDAITSIIFYTLNV